ncbi:hypothetical protein [Winslowiella iniecta]|uniref:Uncharacterized protein n=1 Tax=Winslowiella iniecta TaxID=1560201 RepID=A0A0L7T4L9_9GAMM|nr:hypothetical protein [Winslowiella iniecta]KOC90300.1 hypothetical protein NG42_09545 [Winslowiella iniecta]KOC94738.1 hypothetical protein NG43_02795 [Winslowiella iniecta]
MATPITPGQHDDLLRNVPYLIIQIVQRAVNEPDVTIHHRGYQQGLTSATDSYFPNQKNENSLLFIIGAN